MLEREHTAVSAAEVVKASHAFQWPPADLDRHATTEARASALIFDRHAKTEALASALILMCVREAGTHPKASEWANRESRLIIELAHNRLISALVHGRPGESAADGRVGCRGVMRSFGFRR